MPVEEQSRTPQLDGPCAPRKDPTDTGGEVRQRRCSQINILKRERKENVSQMQSKQLTVSTETTCELPSNFPLDKFILKIGIHTTH